MKKFVFTALCIASVVALPGCWCSKEEQKPAEPVAAVATEEVKTAEALATEAAKPAEQPTAPEASKPAEAVPAKM